MKIAVFLQPAKYQTESVDRRLPARRTITVRHGASILTHGEDFALWPMGGGSEWQRACTPLQPGGGRKGVLRRRLSGDDDSPRRGK
ncbi:hypothetical protein FSB08_14360 [Paraburkholderia sp. JPY432]|uniref:hypothetical protein n=1 Tax=Paraburkholderia youngii TaxID=2782701 RepID=UPI00159594A2|nr:hypothetical protein [Paraburkholderia youngii]NVH73715.1 hypothetical protein [Paraburkholderia youngii]